ncbi:T6SS immunity protein Tli4 family protein [Massilia sp. X63]|uniref:T6SS immunity protein Tli4 family protein n=1 Tax=Massilia sp. X63 TaxID=3237285 RepID=UPI0034DD1F1F
MDTGRGDGRAIPSSLSDTAALALWDKTLTSIRVRSTVQPTPKASNPALVPTL